MKDSFLFQRRKYFYDSDKPTAYWYETASYENFISYSCLAYDGMPHKVEFRIPGPRDRELAMRMSRKFEPWDVIEQYDRKST